MTDILGCVVKGISQITRTTLLHVSVTVCKFSGLVCRWRAASVSKDFVRRFKVGKITDFSKNHGCWLDTDTGNRKNRWIQFIHDFLNRNFNFINLGGEFPNEFNGMLQFQKFSRHNGTNGSSGSISNLDSLIFAITTLGCCRKKVCQLGEMNFWNLFCTGIFTEERINRSNMERGNELLQFWKQNRDQSGHWLLQLGSFTNLIESVSC